MATHTKIPARDWPWAINTGTVAVPVWTPIGGLDTWGHKPTKSDADSTTFDDDGRKSHFVASRGDEFSLTGKYKEDHEGGARDAGQEAIETLGNAIGIDSLKQFKVTSPGGTEKKFMASAVVTIGGGGNEDSSKWEATLTVDGTITTTPPA